MKDLSILFCITVLATVCACKKDKYVGKDPYEGAKPPLEIELSSTTPLQGTVKAGAIVTLTGKGFMKYKDSGMVVKFNDIEGLITGVTDNGIQVKVPELASSGLVSLTIKRQIFAGPQVRISGPIYIDSLFHSVPGANNGITCIEYIPGNKYMIGGNFTDYDNSGLKDGVKGLARINPDGSLDQSFVVGKGVAGTVTSLIVQSNGKYVVGGSFGNYNERFKPGYISNIVRLNTNGSIDSTIITTQTGKKDTVPALNAYFDGPVTKVLQTADSGKIVVIGYFRHFLRKDFTISTADHLRDSVKIDSIRMEGIVRLHEDGSFDSSFNYNPVTRGSFSGANGFIMNAIMQDDGKLMIVGDFTKYHDKPANRIARLDQRGQLDNSFSADIDNTVYTVAAMPGNKYLVAGLFLKVNGGTARKVAVLNSTGAIDKSFSVGDGPLDGANGIISTAARLKNGKIFLAGGFDLFSGMKRSGTVILDEDGKVSQQFNNLGPISGGISQLLNMPNTNATLVVGYFNKYDLQSFNRIALLRY